MNTTKTKRGAGARPAIEPVLGVTTSGYRVALGGGPDDKSDYYLVNTDEFRQIIPKGGVIEVSPGDLKPGELALMSGAEGLKILPYKKYGHLRTIGKITHVEYWPGQIAKKARL